MIGGVAALILIFAAILFTPRFLDAGKSKEATPNPNQNIGVQPPVVSVEAQPNTPVITAEPVKPTSSQTPSPSSSQPPKSAATPAADSTAGTAPDSLKNAAKPVWIKVSTAKQIVTVFDANDQIIESFVCSTGLNGADTETPTGTYKIAERGESFFSQTYQQGAYYWTQFYGDYLFHSVPFDSNRVIEVAEAAKLGTKASHGCVRLSIENAKWIYDNIPRGTVVVIE